MSTKRVIITLKAAVDKPLLFNGIPEVKADYITEVFDNSIVDATSLTIRVTSEGREAVFDSSIIAFIATEYEQGKEEKIFQPNNNIIS